MTDISREEMGLIIGLVIGTLFLALLAVVIYIVYDKQKDKMFGIFRITAPVDQPRTGPTGGTGHTWTTINNSMVGLEMDDAQYSHYGHEAEQTNQTQENEGNGLHMGNRKSCLTVLFDWDVRSPLPQPFRHFTNGLWQHSPDDWETTPPSKKSGGAAGAKKSLDGPSGSHSQPSPGTSSPASGPGGSGGGAACSHEGAGKSDETREPAPVLPAAADAHVATPPSDSVAVPVPVAVSSTTPSRRMSLQVLRSRLGLQLGCCGIPEPASLNPSKADIKCVVCVNPNEGAGAEEVKRSTGGGSPSGAAAMPGPALSAMAAGVVA